MSYDVYARYGDGDDARCVEPYFTDTLPAFGSDGMAGTAVLTETGYARCGNYTSNVSGMWAKCLTAVMRDVPGAELYAGNDDRYMLANYGETIHYVDGTKGVRTVRTDALCLRDLAGQRCGDLADLLKAAVEWGVEHIDELREANPANGWGNAEGAVTFLWDIQRLCEQEPNAVLGISS